MFTSKNMNSHCRSTKSARSGFTLVEVMVVIAVIALLVSLVIVALKSSSAASTRTRSLNALREIVRGYRAYSDDNRGQLMPGYIGEDLMAVGELFENLRVTLPEGFELNEADSQSYVWRLAPYVNNVWEVFYTELGDSGMEAQLQDEFTAFNFSTIAERPTFGMNSIFVGGDSVHGGNYATDRHPWQNDEKPIAATRFTQVKNPARLIVFGSATRVLTAIGPEGTGTTSLGFCELRAPFLEFSENHNKWFNQQWLVGTGGKILTTGGSYSDPGAGIPITRSGQDLMPVAMLDGSASIEIASELAGDMRRWNPFEVGLHGH